MSREGCVDQGQPVGKFALAFATLREANALAWYDGSVDSAGKTYDGAAFLADGNRVAGALRVTPAGVQFTAGDVAAMLPMEGLQIRVGGAADRLIFFEHPSLVGQSVYTSDASVLEEPALAVHHAQLGSIRRGARRRVGAAFAVICVLLAVVLGLWASRGLLVAAVARRVPPSVERKIGDLAMRQIVLTATVESNPAVTEPMQQILRAVSTGVATTPYDFRLLVIQDESVNAFALPGGQLAIHTGLIAKARNGDEVAGVLAHEIAHVTEQHSLRQIISSVGLFALIQALFGDVSGVIAVAADAGANLLTLRFSRDAERDADAEGVAILDRAGLTPRGMITFFTTLKSEEGVAGSIPAFLSTHPATEERAAELRKTVAAANASKLRSVPIDIRGAQKAIAGKLPSR